MHDFRITGLRPDRFAHLFGRNDDELRRFGAQRMISDSVKGYPDRCLLRDVEPGSPVLLLNYEHQPALSPFRSSHAIFVREFATGYFDEVNVVPPVLESRMLALRAFDREGMLRDAELTPGTELREPLARLFADPGNLYVQAHFAARGCFAATIERA